MYFNLLWNEFATLPEVEAIALGGSRAGANYDEKSDYDLYIYCNRQTLIFYIEISGIFHRQSAWSLRNIQPITVIRPACGITCYTARFSAIKTGNWKSSKISIGFHIRTNCGTILSVKICAC